MLHETQRTSAPRIASVSIRTAVWIIMCSEPMIFAPLRGSLPLYSARIAIRPGISCSARRISLRPHSARLRSATLNGSLPAAFARSNGCAVIVAVVIIHSLLMDHRRHGARRITPRRRDAESRFSKSFNSAPPCLCVGRRLVTSCVPASSSCHEQPWASGTRVFGQIRYLHAIETGLCQELAHLIIAEAQPDMAHLLTIFLSMVRRHIHDQHPAARL